MEEALLHKAAVVWHELSQHKYSFTYGYRMKLYTINLSFSPEDFPHLAGFQYLKDLTLPRFTPAKTVSKILDGTITQEQVEKGLQYEEMVKPRLFALASLEEMLDNDFSLYSFMPRFYSFVTSIRADYLIASHMGDVSFVFLIREGERSLVSDCICCSAFQKDGRDYEQNQRPFTLMKKVKTKLLTNETRVLFLKDGFKDPEAVETSDSSTVKNADASDNVENIVDCNEHGRQRL